MVTNLGGYLHHSRLLLCTTRLRLMLLLLNDIWLFSWPIIRCRSNKNNIIIIFTKFNQTGIVESRSFFSL